EALSTVTARGRLAAVARAMIFVPLPRLVFPTARPLFLRWRNCRRSAPPSAPAVPRRAVSSPARGGSSPTARNEPTAGNVHAPSGTADTAPAAPAIAPRCAKSTALRSKPLACPPADVPAYPHAAENAATAPTKPNPHPTLRP